MKKNAYMTVTTYRYSERARTALLVGLVALPTLAVDRDVVSVCLDAAPATCVGSQAIEGRTATLRQKKFAAALREYNEAIQTSPDLAERYFRRGSLYHTMGEKAHALADFERAIVRDPRLAPAYLLRGKICLESGDVDSALADFGMLMTIRANDPETLLNRGICLVKKGQWSDAAIDLQRVLKLTNHSDFAEPAKQYLRECESNAPKPLPAAGSNGSAPPRPPKSRALLSS